MMRSSFSWAQYCFARGSVAKRTCAQLLVNAIGSFLGEAIMHVGLSTEILSPTVRIALAVGVMGGFTTYSSFSFETFRFLQEGAWGLAFLYVASMVLGCLVACALGFGVAKWFVGA